MNKTIKLLAMLAILLTAFCRPAFAHVSYKDIGINANGITVTTYYPNGWWYGTQSTLGDSHFLNGAIFFKFTLAQPQNVTITFTDTTSTNSLALNPAFTLYRGLLPANSHDTAAFDNQNPTNP